MPFEIKIVSFEYQKHLVGNWDLKIAANDFNFFSSKSHYSRIYSWESMRLTHIYESTIQTWIRWEHFVNLATNKDDAKREIAHENALCEKYWLWYAFVIGMASYRCLFLCDTLPLNLYVGWYHRMRVRTQPHRISHTSIFNDITLRIVTHIMWISNCQRLSKAHGVRLREKEAAAITKKYICKLMQRAHYWNAIKATKFNSQWLNCFFR